MLTRGFDANGNTIYTDSVTGQSTSDSSAYDAQQAINPNNLSAAYQQVYGAAPNQDWLNLTHNARLHRNAPPGPAADGGGGRPRCAALRGLRSAPPEVR